MSPFAPSGQIPQNRIPESPDRRRVPNRQEVIMAAMNELNRFRTVWEMEARLTTQLLEALPADQ